ncbi:MAG: TGS domain-containing protein [Nitrospirae bacterium]|nr:TGS domain-containing protein [Nitrospirota bacterium]
MPANLPPEYFEAEKRFKETITVAEKILALEDLISTVPKHKGTDKLRGDLRRKLSKLREESLASTRKGRHADIFTIEREGASQICLAGVPNSGKSSILASLTNAKPVIADYPISTLIPIPGMMPFEDIQIQLVDLPPIGNNATDGWISGILRNADAIMLIIDLTDDPAGYCELLLSKLISWNIHPLCRGEVLPRPYKGVSKWILIVGNKLDSHNAEMGFRELRERYNGRYPVISVSAEKKMNLEELKKAIFGISHIIRIYSKAPGKDPDLLKPFTLKEGATIFDLAGKIHKDYLEKLKFARIWGSSRFEGQKVQRDYVLKDRDIVELHV